MESKPDLTSKNIHLHKTVHVPVVHVTEMITLTLNSLRMICLYYK